ncbi:MAG: hypothetical protein GF309_14060 [Candidatus Lokiarchaeota archaeon]|nr:hypothetical protein [Candidatus Lokiarchaeota archaeon]
MKSVRDSVRERRERDQIKTAKRARHFTGLETLILGIRMSNLALKMAGARDSG